MTGSNPELYGLPKPNHKFFEAHPTQSVELPLRLGSGDITPKGNVARLDGRTVHFEDGTSDDFDVIVYATGYNITFPFFDPDFLSAPEQPDPALQADVQARASTTSSSSASPRRRRRCSRSSSAQARLLAAYAVGPLRAARRRGDGAGRSTRTRRSTSATCSTARATPSRSTTSSTSTTCAPRRSPPGWSGRACRARRRCSPGRAAGPAATGVIADGATGGARALLEALDEHLRDAEPTPLDDINVADISRRAGVTRSAFYFYFENKADAVAALMEEMYDESARAPPSCSPGDGAVRRPGRGDDPRPCSRRWERRRTRLPRDARGPGDQPGGARAVGQRPGGASCRHRRGVIDAERRAGLAPPGPDADALATRAPRRSTTGRSSGWSWAPTASTGERHVEAVVHVWLRTIYGRNA